MKLLIALICLIFCLSNSFSQTQTFNKLEVKELGLPNSTASKVMVTNENKKAQSSNITINELESLSGASPNLQGQINSKASASDVSVLSGKVDTLESKTSNIDNTSDANKPISTATQAALNLKANDSDVVHISGNESISGMKSFTGKINLSPKTNSQIESSLTGSGDIGYNGDKKLLQFHDGTKIKNIGSGSGVGGINYIENYSFEDDATGWVAYNDGSVSAPTDGTGGTATVSIIASAATPLIGERSLVLSKPASNVQGQGFSVDFSLQPAFVNKTNTIEFAYKNSSSMVDGDIVLYLYDKTNSSFINLDNKTLKSNTLNGYHNSSFTATNSTSYRLIFHIATTSTASYSLWIDNVKVGPFSEKFVQTNVDNAQETQSYTPVITTETGSMTNYTASGKWIRRGDRMQIEGMITFSGSSGTWTGVIISIPSGYEIDQTKKGSYIYGFVSATDLGVAEYPSGVPFYSSTTTFALTPALINTFSGQAPLKQGTYSNSFPFTFNSGDKISFMLEFPVKGWTATTPALLGQTDTFSTDSANLFFKSTACTSSEIGCFNTYSYAANSNTRTLCTTAPTQTTSHMNTNGIQIFTRAYNVASTCASPAAVDLVIGKGMKGVTRDLYYSTAKSNSGSLDYALESTATDYGARINNYSESIGVLSVDAGIRQASIANSRFLFSDLTAQTSGYLVINASKSPVVMGQMLGMAKIVSFSFGASAGCATACTSGTCTLCNVINPSNVSFSVGYVSTGVYQVNGIDGTKAVCTGGGGGNNYASMYSPVDTGTSSYTRIVFGDSTTAYNVRGSVTCVVP